MHIVSWESEGRYCRSTVLCPSPSPHLWVRVLESKSKKNSSPSHKSSIPHIWYFLYLPKHENKQNIYYRVEKAQHGTATTAWTRALLGPSHDFWVRVRVKVKKNWTRVRVIKKLTRVTQHCRSKMFHWEPEGRYRHTPCTAIAPFWFSMEHLWIAITIKHPSGSQLTMCESLTQQLYLNKHYLRLLQFL